MARQQRLQGRRIFAGDELDARLALEEGRLLDRVLAELVPKDSKSPNTWQPENENWKRLKELGEARSLRRSLRASSRSRWIVPAILIAVGLVVALLLSIEVGATPVEIAITSTFVRFVPIEETSSLKPIPFRAASFHGKIENAGAGTQCTDIDVRGTGENLLPTVDPFDIPANDTITLEMGQPSGVQLGFTQSKAAMSLSLPGSVSVTGCGGPGAPQERAAVVEFSADDSGSLVALLREGLSPDSIEIRSPMPVRALEFHRSQRLTATKSATVSTVRSGAIHFEDLGDAKFDLREGQLLKLASADGFIDSLRVGDKSISTRFRGTVSELTLGSGKGARSLLPTRYAALRQNNKLAVWYTGTVWAFLLLVALKKWWENPS